MAFGIFSKKNKKSDNTGDLGRMITSIQNGDNEAFSDLYNLYYNDVFKIAMTNTHDYDKACDITQETFIEIFNTIKSLREPDAFHAWMKKIAYHRCTNYFRSKEYKHEVIPTDTDEINEYFDNIAEDRTDFIPEASLDAKELGEIIRKFVEELPEEQRDAVTMYYFNEMSVSEIAEIQGIPADTAKSRLFYARRSLKKAVEEYERRYGISLHGIMVAPMLKWAFEGGEFALSAETAAGIAGGISAATGVSVTASTAAVTAAGAAAATAGSGIWAAAVATPIAAKVTAVIATVAIVAAPVAVAVEENVGKRSESDVTAGITETVDPTDDTTIGMTAEPEETTAEPETTVPETEESETTVLETEEPETTTEPVTTEPETEPAPTYTITDITAITLYTTTNLNCRVEPDASASLVTNFATGTALTATKQTDTNWYYVTNGASWGWCSGDYLTTTAPETTTATTADPNWLGAPEVTTNASSTSAPVTEPIVSSEPDTSSLTWTTADVGKVIGFDSMLNQDITVVKVTECVNGLGLKGITVSCSNGTAITLAECGYCHELPCPDGGGESCTMYNIQNDSSKTCVDCGLPRGDGYNGTCHRTTDWDNGGKTSCNHYD